MRKERKIKEVKGGKGKLYWDSVGGMNIIDTIERDPKAIE